MDKLSSWKLPLAFVTVLVIGLAAYRVYLWGVADMRSYQIHAFIKEWSGSVSNRPDLEAIDQRIASLDVMLESWPDNAEYWDLKARLFWLKSSVGDVDQQKVLLSDALSFYERSISLRPKWAHSWAGRSLIKAYLGQLDDEFNEGFVQGAKLGPWEISTSLILLETGLLAWNNLTEQQVNLTIQVASRASEQDPRKVKQLLLAYHKRIPICAALPRTAKQYKVCT